MPSSRSIKELGTTNEIINDGDEIINLTATITNYSNYECNKEEVKKVLKMFLRS